MTTRTAPVQASCTCRACDILGQRVARGAPGSANVPSPICRQWRLASRTRMGWWLRRRRGVGLRSERPGITGPWGRRRRGTRGPTRSHERPWGQRSVHRSAKTAPRRRSGAFVWLRRRGQAWEQRSVHRSAKTALRSRFGAFVYIVATRAASGGTKASIAMAHRRRRRR